MSFDYVKKTDKYKPRVDFDLDKDKISIDAFKKKVYGLPSLDGVNLYLKIGDVIYRCLYDDVIYFMDNSYTDQKSKYDHTFLKIMLIDPVYCEIRTEKNGKRFDITCLPERTVFETVIHLLVMFCKMLGIKKIRFTDIAEKEGYNLLYYRIFFTKNPLSDLSIYSKFFKKIEYSSCEKDEKEITQTLYEIRDCLIDGKTLDNYFKDNTNFSIPANSTKGEIIKIKMKKVIAILYQIEKYTIFFECVNHFIVNVDDYIPSILLLHRKPKFKKFKKSKKSKYTRTKNKSKHNRSKKKSKHKI